MANNKTVKNIKIKKLSSYKEHSKTSYIFLNPQKLQLSIFNFLFSFINSLKNRNNGAQGSFNQTELSKYKIEVLKYIFVQNIFILTLLL